MASNATIGNLILTVTLTIFVYYFFWIAVLPFMRIDDGTLLFISYNLYFIHSFLDNWIYLYFPPLQYAFIGPVIFGVIFTGSITLFTAYNTGHFPNFFR